MRTRQVLIGPVCALLVAGLAPIGPAQAQGWGALPNGDLAYTADYSTTGSFFCSGQYLLPGSCTNVANGITITNGAASATFLFMGTSGTMVASTNGSALIPMIIGRIETSFAGSGAFAFPSVQSPANPLATLSVGISLAGGGSATWRSGFINETGLAEIPRNCCSGVGINERIGIPQTPLRPGGSGLVIHDFTTPVLSSTGGGVQQLSALPSVVPEPSTWALLGTGLLTLGAIAARRRKRADA